jgi:hypothetical protein
MCVLGHGVGLGMGWGCKHAYKGRGQPVDAFAVC